MKHREMQLPGLPGGDAARAGVVARGRAACRAGDLARARPSTAGATRRSRSGSSRSDYAVYALDHRGHGRSGGERANIERFAYVVSDLGTFVGRAQRAAPGAPAFLIGHSMGGAIALACALRYAEALKGLVLSAPALAPGRDRVAAQVLAGPPAVASWRPTPARSLCRASADQPRSARWCAPTSRTRSCIAARSRRGRSSSCSSHGRFAARAAELRVPVLVQHGTADSLVPLVGNAAHLRGSGSRRRGRIRTYDGLFHEIYNEPERDRVIADLEAWLDAQPLTGRGFSRAVGRGQQCASLGLDLARALVEQVVAERGRGGRQPAVARGAPRTRCARSACGPRRGAPARRS